MPRYLVTVKHSSGICKDVILHGTSLEDCSKNLLTHHPKIDILHISEHPEDVAPSVNKHRSPFKIRNTYKARLTGIRNNLQSMLEDESGLLTQEELLQITRITCKLGNVISLFHTRTLDMKKEGIL